MSAIETSVLMDEVYRRDVTRRMAHPEYRIGFARGHFLARRQVKLPSGNQEVQRFLMRQQNIYEDYHCISIEHMVEFYGGILAGLLYPLTLWDDVVTQCERRGWHIEETQVRLPDCREKTTAFNLFDVNGAILLWQTGAVDIEMYCNMH